MSTSALARSSTPPPLSPAGLSSSGSSVDISGCMPTPSPRSPGPKRLRGIQWIPRLQKQPLPEAQPVPEEVHESQGPLPPPDPPLFQQPSNPSLGDSVATVLSQRDEEDVFVQSATQGRRLARELFPEDAHLYATEMIAGLPSWGVHQQETEDSSEHEEEVDELQSSPSQAPTLPTGSLHLNHTSELRSQVKQPTNIHRSYGRNAAGQARTAAWQRFREQVGSVPAKSKSEGSRPASTDASEADAQLLTRRASAPAESPATHQKRSGQMTVFTNEQEQVSQPLSRQSFRPRQRPKALPSEPSLAEAAEEDSQEVAQADIPVPYPADYQQEVLPDELNAFSRVDEQETPMYMGEPDSSNEPAYMTRRAARMLQNEQKRQRLAQKRNWIKHGQSIVHEAIVERPEQKHHERAGHAKLEMGYMIPTPQDQVDMQEGRTAAQIIRRRIKQNIPADVRETSFGSHLVRKRKRAIQESSQETGNDDDDDSPPPSLPEHDYVGATPPPSPGPPRKPLSELRAGKYAVEQVEERMRSTSAPVGNGLRCKSGNKKKVKFDPKTTIPKGHSALLIGPADGQAAPEAVPRSVVGKDNSAVAELPKRTIAEQSKLRRQQMRRRPLAAKIIPVVKTAPLEGPRKGKASDNVLEDASEAVRIKPALQREQTNIGSLQATAVHLHRRMSASQPVQSRIPRPLKPAYTVIDPTLFRLPSTNPSIGSHSVPARRAILAGPSEPFTVATDDTGAAMYPDVLAGPSCAYTVDSLDRAVPARPLERMVAPTPEVARLSSSMSNNTTAGPPQIFRLMQAELEAHRFMASTKRKVDVPLPAFVARGTPVLPKQDDMARSAAPGPVTPVKGELPARPPLSTQAAHEQSDLVQDEPSTPPPAAQPAASPAATQHVSSDGRATSIAYIDAETETGKIVVQETPSPPLPESPASYHSPETLVTLQSKSKRLYGACHQTIERKGLGMLGGEAQFPAPAQKRKRVIEQDTQAGTAKISADHDPFIVR